MADSTKEATKPIGWLPLESNPEVLNPFLWKLGVPGEWGFCDVFGLDPELLAMVPRPCMALCLLFPCEKIAKERRPALRAARRDRVEADKADPDNDEARIRNEAEGGVFFLEQVQGTGNACGTVACLHAVGNAVAGAAAVGWEAVYAKPAAKRARLGAAERAALEALPHRYVEDLSGLLPLIGITGGPPAGSGGLAELRNTPD